MKTTNQILKIRAALLYVLQRFPKGIDYMKLFKILYYAQQYHLVKYGRVIIEDSFNARTHGPVPAFLYKALRLLTDGNLSSEEIKLCVSDINVNTTGEIPVFTTNTTPDMDELSRSDVMCLDQSIDENKGISSYQLSEKSHQDKAWINAYRLYENDPELGKMTAIEIAKAGGAKRGMINYIRENQFIDKALSL
jgi:uncharacterized phage-associated protein